MRRNVLYGHSALLGNTYAHLELGVPRRSVYLAPLNIFRPLQMRYRVLSSLHALRASMC